jgi:hypothetical protein
MTHVEALILAQTVLKKNRQQHYHCEDSWYSCPKHEEGCANEDAGNECNCGADSANIEIDAAIATIEQVLQT